AGGIATALGEHERRTLAAGLNVPRNDPLVEEKKRIAAAMQDGSITQEQIDGWTARAAARVRSNPLTEVQCAFVTLASREYVAKNRLLPITQMITFTPRMFQSDKYGDVSLNYA